VVSKHRNPPVKDNQQTPTSLPLSCQEGRLQSVIAPRNSDNLVLPVWHSPEFWNVDTSIGGGSFWDAPREMLILEPNELRQKRAAKDAQRASHSSGFAVSIRDYSASAVNVSRPSVERSESGCRKTLKKQQPSRQTIVESPTREGDELEMLRRYFESEDVEEPPGGDDIDVSIGMLKMPNQYSYSYLENWGGANSRRRFLLHRPISRPGSVGLREQSKMRN
jgi:hypothetical protein